MVNPPPPPPPPPPETFTTTTSQQGSLLILQNQTSTDTIRIGLETAWGGSIVEVSLNGTNFVNAHDTGREVQPAFYDGNAHYDSCAGCTGVFGWDPVLGGDKYRQGSAALSQVRTSNPLYTKAHPLQWNPDDKGGGPGQAVAGDVIVEQTITPVSGRSRVFQGHYKVTHLGSDLHANAQQEFPAVYVNADYNRFVHYGGTAPWTSPADIFTPFGATDQPSAGSTVGVITTLSGWSFDDVSVAKVEILVDGVVDGTASYGSSRPDVAGTYPGAPVNIGFSYLLNTAKYSNGAHTLNVQATDSSGNVAVFPDVGV